MRFAWEAAAGPVYLASSWTGVLLTSGRQTHRSHPTPQDLSLRRFYRAGRRAMLHRERGCASGRLSANSFEPRPRI